MVVVRTYARVYAIMTRVATRPTDGASDSRWGGGGGRARFRRRQTRASVCPAFIFQSSASRSGSKRRRRRRGKGKLDNQVVLPPSAPAANFSFSVDGVFSALLLEFVALYWYITRKKEEGKYLGNHFSRRWEEATLPPHTWPSSLPS